MVRISASVRDASASMTSSASTAASGSGRGDDPPGLGPDRDGRDVVGDGVVQLAGQLLALAQLDLVELAQPGGGPVADRGAERRREQQDHARRATASTTPV